MRGQEGEVKGWEEGEEGARGGGEKEGGRGKEGKFARAKLRWEKGDKGVGGGR